MNKESSQRPVTAGAMIYLMEELGDARLRCDQLVRYTSEASKLIENSTHRDHFFEIAGQLIQSIPETLFKLQKALQAVSLAATRMDYEELKQELRPEKVDQLERVLQDVRIRHVQRRSEPWTPEQAAKTLRGMMAAIRESGLLPRTELMGLILDLEFGVRKADSPDVSASLEAVATSLENAKAPPSQLQLSAILRRVLADDYMKTPQEQTMDRSVNWKAETTKKAATLGADGLQQLGSEEEVRTKFKKENPDLTDAQLDEIVGQWHKNKDVVKDKSAAWKAPDAKVSAEIPNPGDEPAFGMEMVNEGIEGALTAMRKAQAAVQSGNTKKMFFNLLGVLNGLGVVGRAYDLPDVGYLMRVYKTFSKMSGAKPSTNFSASDHTAARRQLGPGEEEVVSIVALVRDGALKGFRVDSPMGQDYGYKTIEAALQGATKKAPHAVTNILNRSTEVPRMASDEEKESRFEEGKPADPTENMSPEDAKKWKEEHDKNKDNFKAAAAMSDDIKLEFGTAALALRNAAKGQQPKKNSIMAVRSIGTALSLMEEKRAFEVLWRAADTMQASGMWDMKTGSDEEKESRFEEGKPADPTENMSPEDAKKWKEEHDKNKDNFKAAAKRTTHLSGKKGFTLCGERAYDDTIVDSVKDATCHYCEQQWKKAHGGLTASSNEWKADDVR